MWDMNNDEVKPVFTMSAFWNRRKKNNNTMNDDIKKEDLEKEEATQQSTENTTAEEEVKEGNTEESKQNAAEASPAEAPKEENVEEESAVAEEEEKEDRKKKKLTPEQKKYEKKIEDLSSQIEKLSKDKETLSAKLEKEKGDYVRLMAEFDNFRRRSAEERLKLVGTASKDTIKGLLPVLDDCERAMQLLEESSDEAAKQGTRLIYDKLMAYLKSKGLEKMEAKGEKFDTDYHEAVAQFPVEDPAMKGCVFDVVTTGYMLGGEVLRYAKVVVGV